MKFFCLGLGLIGIVNIGLAGTALPFTDLTLVDRVQCGDAADTHLFQDYPISGSSTGTILGASCRIMPPRTGGLKYFSYRIGKDCGLIPGKGYILEVEYPEDEPRSMFIINGGCETTRGFHTGNTLGDALESPYINSNPESIAYPLSQSWKKTQTLFYLHDRFPGIQEPRSYEYSRPLLPADGFWVTVAIFQSGDDPTSEGAAVRTISLYEAPTFEELALPLNLPPAGLPRRHLFAREEMSSGVVESLTQSQRGLNEPIDWYEYKVRQLRFLGMDTYTLDLLEFGSNQGWDSSKYGGNAWVYQNDRPQIWNSILDMLGNYDLSVLPMYEYCGSKGSMGLGFEKRCKTLGGNDDYTHIPWTENANADITDPDTLEDFRRMLEITIRDTADRKRILGAWVRPRNSGIPISFSDTCLALFATEENGGTAITRAQLQSDTTLYDRYLAWWFEQRREFLLKIRDYLRTAGALGPDAAVLFTPDASESGVSYPAFGLSKYVITDDVSLWTGGLVAAAMDLDSAIATDRHYQAMTLPKVTWAPWEWQHSVPSADPQRYTDTDGVMMTYTFNKAYTVGSSNAFDAFQTDSGLAMIRHYSLNEDAMREGTNVRKLGYFVSDSEPAGPYCMMAEVRAMAYGDPRYIGYLSSSTWSRSFPEYARRFNAAFLSLPALPSVRVEGAASHADVIVRRIDTDEDGTWLSLANTGLEPHANVTVTLPFSGRVFNAATGQEIAANAASIQLNFDACELKSLRILPHDYNAPPVVTVPADHAIEWIHPSVSGEVVETTLSGSWTDADLPSPSLISACWSVESPGSKRVFIESPNSLTTRVTFSGADMYRLRLTVSDGERAGFAETRVHVRACPDHDLTRPYGVRTRQISPDKVLINWHAWGVYPYRLYVSEGTPVNFLDLEAAELIADNLAPDGGEFIHSVSNYTGAVDLYYAVIPFDPSGPSAPDPKGWIQVTADDSMWGDWFAVFWSDWGTHDVSGKTHLQFSLKTISGDISTLQVNAGGSNVVISAYATITSDWTNVSIPLADLGGTPSSFQSVIFKRGQLPQAVFGVDEVAFVDGSGGRDLVWGDDAEHAAYQATGGTDILLAKQNTGGAPLPASGSTDPANGLIFGLNQISAALPCTISADLDDDGLPDVWEQSFFENTDISDAFADQDYDGDGLSDLDEFRSGTNPTNRLDGLFIMGLSDENTGALTVKWQSRSNCKYRLERKAKLDSSWLPLQTGISANPPENIVPLAQLGGQQSFVRVVMTDFTY